MNFGHSVDSDRDLSDIPSRLYKLLPTQIQDMVATFIFLVMLPLGFLLHIFWVLPHWYPAFGEAWVIRVSILLFFAFNLYTNWLMMMRVGPNGKSPVLPNVVQAGFRYCHSCHLNAPPRAYHCPVCNTCAFRRDHHCSFGGVCIGHFNQRYFCGAVFSLFCVTAPLVNYAWDMVWIQLGGFSLGKLWTVCLPHIAFVFRVISFWQFLNVLVLACTGTVLLFTVYLITAQLFVLWKGQTRVEYLLEVHAYQLGLFENLRQALGANWFLIGVSAFIPSPLPSNGMSFTTREMGEHHSSKDL